MGHVASRRSKRGTVRTCVPSWRAAGSTRTSTSGGTTRCETSRIRTPTSISPFERPGRCARADAAVDLALGAAGPEGAEALLATIPGLQHGPVGAGNQVLQRGVLAGLARRPAVADLHRGADELARGRRAQVLPDAAGHGGALGLLEVEGQHQELRSADARHDVVLAERHR